MANVKKIKPWELDFEFYLANSEKFVFFGSGLDERDFNDSLTGKTAKEAFKFLDSEGKVIPCKEIDILKKVITCKKSINFNIKQWSEGYPEFGEPIETYINEFINPPAWVEKALRGSIDRYFKDVWYPRHLEKEQLTKSTGILHI